MRDRIGFMQGRLSPIIDGRIQAFPWTYWQDEFRIAEEHDFRLMEWTLDQDRLYENPLLTDAGQVEVRALCRGHGIGVPSLTGDCFMQAPFWKEPREEREALQRDFRAVVEACAQVGILMIVVPLVDGGRLEDRGQEDTLVAFMESHQKFFADHDLRVSFESDFGPVELARFIGRLDPDRFGVNYDTGNNAALGFTPTEEFEAYGRRIINVHVKDRVFGGTTVALETGDADFPTVFDGLNRIGYAGYYILQTARAAQNDHPLVLSRYRDMTTEWLARL